MRRGFEEDRDPSSATRAASRKSKNMNIYPCSSHRRQRCARSRDSRRAATSKGKALLVTGMPIIKAESDDSPACLRRSRGSLRNGQAVTALGSDSESSASPPLNDRRRAPCAASTRVPRRHPRRGPAPAPAPPPSRQQSRPRFRHQHLRPLHPCPARHGRRPGPLREREGAVRVCLGSS
jgi:hypothetical protein